MVIDVSTPYRRGLELVLEVATEGEGLRDGDVQRLSVTSATTSVWLPDDQTQAAVRLLTASGAEICAASIDDLGSPFELALPYGELVVDVGSESVAVELLEAGAEGEWSVKSNAVSGADGIARLAFEGDAERIVRLPHSSRVARVPSDAGAPTIVRLPIERLDGLPANDGLPPLVWAAVCLATVGLGVAMASFLPDPDAEAIRAAYAPIPDAVKGQKRAGRANANRGNAGRGNAQAKPDAAAEPGAAADAASDAYELGKWIVSPNGVDGSIVEREGSLRLRSGTAEFVRACAWLKDPRPGKIAVSATVSASIPSDGVARVFSVITDRDPGEDPERNKVNLYRSDEDDEGFALDRAFDFTNDDSGARICMVVLGAGSSIDVAGLTVQ